MKQLQVFNFDSSELRVSLIDGESWWAARDVCNLFGETNHNRAMKVLDKDEKGYTQISNPGGKQNVAFINKYCVYLLIKFQELNVVFLRT